MPAFFLFKEKPMSRIIEEAETLLQEVEKYKLDHPDSYDHLLDYRVETLKNLIYLGVEEEINKERCALREEFYFKTNQSSFPCLP